MGKICKYANLYDKDGKLIRHVNEHGILPKPELEAPTSSKLKTKDPEKQKALAEVAQILENEYDIHADPAKIEEAISMMDEYVDFEEVA